MQIDRDRLLAILPSAPYDKLDEYMPLLNAAMAEADVTSLARVAMFIAQTGVESNQYNDFVEMGRNAGALYEGRAILGNTHPGDGRRFKGRGAIQLTGRANYTGFSKAVGVDFTADPDLVATPQYAFRAASWFWKTRGLNAVADAHDLSRATRIINGGLIGLAQRAQFYAHAIVVLNAVAPEVA